MLQLHTALYVFIKSSIVCFFVKDDKLFHCE